MSRYKSLFKKFETDKESVYKRLLNATAWNLLGLIVNKGFPFLASILIARLLGPQLNGELGIITSTTSVFVTFAVMGLGMTSTKFIAQYKKDNPNLASKVLGVTNFIGILMGLILAIILFILSDWLASNQLNAPHLAICLKIASITIFFSAFNGVQRGTLSGFEWFRQLALVDIIIGIITVVLNLLSAITFGILGLVVAQAITSAINTVVYTIYIRKANQRYGIKVDLSGLKTELSIIWKVSIPAMLSSIMVGPVVWICETILVNTDGGYESLGIFNAANQWRSILGVLPGVLNTAILPILISQNKEGNANIEKFNILASWVFVSSCCLPLFIFPEFIAKLYGNNYNQSAYVQTLCIILLYSIVYSYKSGIARKLITDNMLWWGVLDNIIWALTMICSILVIKNLGSVGMAISYLLSYVFSTIVLIPIYLKKQIIPRNLVISKWSLVIWTIPVVQMGLALLDFNIWFRIIYVIPAILILCFSVLKIFGFSKGKLI